MRVPGQLLLQLPHPPFAGLQTHGEILNLPLQLMAPPIHLQQHPEDRLLPRTIDPLGLFPGHHPLNLRRKSLTSGYGYTCLMEARMRCSRSLRVRPCVTPRGSQLAAR